MESAFHNRESEAIGGSDGNDGKFLDLVEAHQPEVAFVACWLREQKSWRCCSWTSFLRPGKKMSFHCYASNHCKQCTNSKSDRLESLRFASARKNA